ncbi:MAG: 4-alpha-glucanotransferase [Terracidiphilus sp.]|jgi:4-alpha-glucanotransferase
MEFQRSSGVLLHISSLPSYGGIGDMGPAAHEFLAFLAEAKQHVWQVLPLCPTGYGNSPYAGSSAFAGNPYLISLEFLADWGWIDGERIGGLAGRGGNVDFNDVEARKLPLLYEAAGNFLDRGPHEPQLAEQWQQFQKFCRAQAGWLNDYALYAELRRQFNTGAWTEWPEPLRRRQPQALGKVAAEHGRALAQEQALQFAFSLQWNRLREAAAKNKIRILGDVAIFVNLDSADVWVNRDLFDLDEELKPVSIAGVPPDYFSPTGQRWGNPLYRWDVLEERGFGWWIERVRRACALYDIVRLDHFRGFEAYWSIPAGEETAINGKWVKAPGLKLFHALEAALGPLALVAEDLGMITPEVEALRLELGMPGMKVLQFGFSGKGAHIHLPHRFTPATVAYTGTHDNDTTQGWWKTAGEVERDAVQAYLGPVPTVNGIARPVWPLIRALEDSVAEMAVVPAQDLLELGSEARMNTPAVPSGNWSWRAPEGSWKPELAERLAALADVTDRDNDPLGHAEEEEAADGKPS